MNVKGREDDDFGSGTAIAKLPSLLPIPDDAPAGAPNHIKVHNRFKIHILFINTNYKKLIQILII